MKVTVVTTGWNEAATVVPFIRYYLDICKFDKFIYYDNESSDNTKYIITSTFEDDPRVIIRDTPYIGHQPEKETELINVTMHEDDSDVFIWVDSDEILVCRNWVSLFEKCASSNKHYIATYMSNVYSNDDSFDVTKYNILDNIDLVFTDKSVFKVPIIVKPRSGNYAFGGGHHSVDISGKTYGVFADGEDDLREAFADPDLSLFHITYINYDMYYRRKTLGRKRNLELNIDNSWYHNYWNLKPANVIDMIKHQKTLAQPISSYL